MRKTLGVTAAIGGVLLTGIAAHAQTPPRTPQETIETQAPVPGERETVRTRPRPEYDPLGVRLGGFFLYPQVSVTGMYRDNIFFDENDTVDDFITVVSPQARLVSNWNNHFLTAYAKVDAGFYVDNTDENYLDGQAGFNGRLDIDRTAYLTGGFDYARLHEDRSSPDQEGAAEPVEYDRYGPTIGLTKRFNRLRVRAGGEAIFYDYYNVPDGMGGTVVMDDRDRVELVGTGEVGYEITPDTEVFVRGTINDRSYDDAVDTDGFNRDSQGWEVVGGVSFDIGAVSWGNVYAGYLSQDFDDPMLPDVTGFSFGGDVTWNPTELTTVMLEARREVEDTTLAGAAGALSSRGAVTVDHELLRNLILTAEAYYEKNDYEGIAREDDRYGAGVGADYLMNRHLTWGLRYSYDARDSNVAGADFSANTVWLKLTAQY